ncbi:MAG TPA: pyridoxal phosphate-dependent aminotransferase family protein [Candidatus Methylomirabilis sp.]|nr:pyridoxal phosphate-dependent aminotransferase family protein [Candidatus Methylomirabilis sp.]
MALGPELRFLDRTRVLHEGKPYLFFGGTDYHRFASHPDVIRALREVAETDGLSCAGSRTTTGNHPLLVELERKLAAFLGVEEAILCSSGYLSNAVVLEAVASEFQRFFIDSGAHSSLAAPASRLPQGTVATFRHADPEDLERELKSRLRPGERPLILTDGVVPVDGEMPPLAAYWTAARDLGGALLVDDAHGVAVVGPSGKGSPEEAVLPAQGFIQTGTLSKGLGAFGGLVAGSAGLADKIRAKSQAFVGATPIPPPIAAAAICSIRILQANPNLIAGLQARTLRVRERVRAMGLHVPPSPAPILSITHHDKGKNLRLHSLLLERGIYPPFIHYPGSPPGGHFRFALSSCHADNDVDLLLEAVGTSCE